MIHQKSEMFPIHPEADFTLIPQGEERLWINILDVFGARTGPDWSDALPREECSDLRDLPRTSTKRRAIAQLRRLRLRDRWVTVSEPKEWLDGYSIYKAELESLREGMCVIAEEVGPRIAKEMQSDFSVQCDPAWFARAKIVFNKSADEIISLIDRSLAVIREGSSERVIH